MISESQQGKGASVQVRLLGHVLGLERSVERKVPLRGICRLREVLRLALEGLGLPFDERLLMNEYVVLVNGRDVRHLEGWETPVEPGDALSIVPPRAGG